jgi:predicted short-subunit dehydrogenase-like oxidoreductase (DUF2520 family)
MLTQRMSDSISIVGTGRVGRALGRHLRQLGWRIDAVTGRSLGSARAAVRVIGGGQALGGPSPQVLNSKVILIATPDDAIAGVAHAFSKFGTKQWRGKVVLHTSGALDSSVLRPLAELGAATGSMHPMQTFSDQNIPDLAKCFFGIEGSPAAIKISRKMIHQLDGIAVRLSGTNKAAYHAAGSLACVYVLTLMETATRILMAQGFKRRQAMRALLPMTRQTLDNFEGVGHLAAWTGPLARQDYSTIELHVKALAEMAPEYLEVYKTLSRLTAKVLAAKPSSMIKMIKQLDYIYDETLQTTKA